MIIYVASSTQTKENLPFVRKISEVISRSDNVIASPIAGKSVDRQNSKKTTTDTSPSTLLEHELDAISHADIVIIEASTYDFTQGYFAATALQQKKPILLLTRGTSNENMQTLLGIKDRLLKLVEYNTEDELVKAVEQFIAKNTISTKDLRFNFFIDRQIYNYLRSVSDETGKNKSELIRELINREIRSKGN